jgi:hypothetical protein
MESFRQLLEYIKQDFEIEQDLEINSDFIKLFHKEFNKYHEKIMENMDFLDEETFESKTPISTWFKEKKEHPKYIRCRNNLYALICVSQDIVGSEMLKGFQNMNPENMHEYMQQMFSGDNNPFSELLDNSPLGDLLKNPQLKEMMEGLAEKFKDINIEELLQQFQSGNFDMSQLSGLLGGLGSLGGTGANNPLGNAMNLLGPLLGNGEDEMAGLTPQQRAKLRRERAKTEYRRKVRAREKERKKNRSGNNKKKRRG